MGTGRDRHVVMAVASGIASDSRVRKTALAVAGLGYRVTLLYGELDGTDMVEGELGPVRTIGLPVRYRSVQEVARQHAPRSRWRTPPPPWAEALPNIIDLGRVFTGRITAEAPDIIHVHDIHLLDAGVTAAKRLRRRMRPVTLLYDAHEYIPGTSQLSEGVEDALKAMEDDLIRMTDGVITVSEPIAESLRSLYDLPARPTVVLNSPSLETPTPGHSDVRTAAGIGPDVPLLVYSGVINRKRGIPTVIEAVAELPHVHLAIVCVPSAADWRAVQLVNYAEVMGVSDRVHCLDPVPPEDIISFLRTADVGVHPLIGGLPNHEMALPNKLFDYLFAGLAVVVSDVELMGAFVRENGVGTWFEPSDTKDCARAIERALADRRAYAAAAARSSPVKA